MRIRDSLFVEVLEKMKHKLDRIEEPQQQLSAPMPEEAELEAPESSSQQEESLTQTVHPKKMPEVYRPGSGTNKAANLGELNVT